MGLRIVIGNYGIVIDDLKINKKRISKKLIYIGNGGKRWKK